MRSGVDAKQEKTSGITASLTCACMLLLLLSGHSVARDKTDTVKLLNGDTFTGEIKMLEHGKLSFATDSLGTVLIEWNDIASTSSRYEFEFEVLDGSRFYGIIGEAVQSHQLEVIEHAQVVPLDMDRVVRITPIEHSFLEQTKGSLSVGLNVVGASDVSQFSFSGNATHRTRARAISLRLSTIVTNTDGETHQRADLGFDLTRFRENRWFNTYGIGLESNDELGLDLRTSFGFGVGRYVMQTSYSEFQVLGGLLASQELLIDGADSVESVEALLGMGYSKYLYDQPNVDIDLQLRAYPSLTERGRVRAQFDARIRREIIEDLFIDLTVYFSFDSDPQTADVEKKDHGIVTSIGWSF